MSHHPGPQYRQYVVIDESQEVKNHNAWPNGVAWGMNNNNRAMEDYGHHAGIDGALESLIKGLHGTGRVKKIEVIQYERKTNGGARQEWSVLSGSGAPFNSGNGYPMQITRFRG